MNTKEYTTTCNDQGRCTSREYKNKLYELGCSLRFIAEYHLDKDFEFKMSNLRTIQKEVHEIGDAVYQAGINLQIHNEVRNHEETEE